MVKVKGASFLGFEISLENFNFEKLKEYFKFQKNFFQSSPIVFKLDFLENEKEFINFIDYLKNSLKLNIVGLKGNENISSLAKSLNLAYFPLIENQKNENPEDPKKDLDQKSTEIFGEDVTIIERNLRAGDIIESENSLVILGDVNFGAKVISNKNIYIMGELRGIAIAGKDNTYGEIRAMYASPQFIEICEKRKEFERDKEFILFKAFYRKGDLDITISSYKS